MNVLECPSQIERCQMARGMNTVISVSQRPMPYSARIQLYISTRVICLERARIHNDKHADAVAMAGRIGFDLRDPRYSDGHRDYPSANFVHFGSAETQESVFSNSIHIQNSAFPSSSRYCRKELRLGSCLRVARRAKCRT
jgi:hypothetical protein